MNNRISVHPILGVDTRDEYVTLTVDGKPIKAIKGEMILAALLAQGIIISRYTEKRKEPRGFFCAIGMCTDCVMIVDGIPNTRTCVTPVKDGMVIETQHGLSSRKVGV